MIFIECTEYDMGSVFFLRYRPFPLKATKQLENDNKKDKSISMETRSGDLFCFARKPSPSLINFV